MDNEEIIRQEAISLYLQGISPSKIGERLTRTRQWVYKWVKRYQSRSNEDWYKEDSKAPKQKPEKTPEGVERAIIKIRKELLEEPYHQTGAINILYRLNDLGIDPPSTATINRIIKRNHLESNDCKRMKKRKDYPGDFFNLQQMDLIGPRYLKGGFRFYLYTIIDVDTHYASVYAITDKSAQSIVPCLIDFWKNFQIPDFLQMDNELTFRGSNRHPRGLGLLLRVALSNSVVPIFIPPAEPWRNGVIEKFNDSVEKRFLNKVTFANFEELSDKAKEFSVFHNEYHHYAVINNATPNLCIPAIGERNILRKEIDLEIKILVDEGDIIFIRFIRGDLKLRILGTVFDVNLELKYSYVIARIVLEKYILIVSREQIIFHVFNFPMSIP